MGSPVRHLTRARRRGDADSLNRPEDEESQGDLEILQMEVDKFLTPNAQGRLPEPLCGHSLQISFLAASSTCTPYPLNVVKEALTIVGLQIYAATKPD